MGIDYGTERLPFWTTINGQQAASIDIVCQDASQSLSYKKPAQQHITWQLHDLFAKSIEKNLTLELKHVKAAYVTLPLNRKVNFIPNLDTYTLPGYGNERALTVAIPKADRSK